MRIPLFPLSSPQMDGIGEQLTGTLSINPLTWMSVSSIWQGKRNAKRAQLTCFRSFSCMAHDGIDRNGAE